MKQMIKTGKGLLWEQNIQWKYRIPRFLIKTM